MQLNPDPSKPENEVIFLEIWVSDCIFLLHSATKKLSKCAQQKHMGAVLNSVCLPRKDLLTIYKSFVRHQVNYGDNLSDKPGNESRKTK